MGLGNPSDLNSRDKHGRIKANSMENYFCYVLDNPTVTLLLCFLAYACVA